MQRELCDMCPIRHPDRMGLWSNLALSLYTQFEWSGDQLLLEEAIDLEREVLCFRPVGHPNRASSCGNLAASLHRRYEHSGDKALFDEAMVLEREALSLPSAISEKVCIPFQIVDTSRKSTNISWRKERVRPKRGSNRKQSKPS
jgi:hypothetical protein